MDTIRWDRPRESVCVVFELTLPGVDAAGAAVAAVELLEEQA